MADHSVIVNDGCIATGSTMLAALRAFRGMGAYEIIVAVPVVPADRLQPIRWRCGKRIRLVTTDDFTKVGDFSDD